MSKTDFQEQYQSRQMTKNVKSSLKKLGISLNEEEAKKVFAEHVRAIKQTNYNDMIRFLNVNVGRRYVEKFKESEVVVKKEIDKNVIPKLLKGEKGIVLLGNVGIGKTMALLYIAKTIIEFEANKYIEEHLEPLERIPVSYFFMPKLFTMLHSGEVPKLEKYVLLDDWGREYAEPFAFSQFETLIEKIYASKRLLVITSNLTENEFFRRPGWERITDRVREMCSVLILSGKSRR